MRLLLVCGLCWLAASAQDTDQKAEEGVASEPVLADVRPRGERADDGDLPPPRRRQPSQFGLNVF